MSEGPGNNGLSSTPGLGSGFALGSMLGPGLGRQGDSNPMYYPQVSGISTYTSAELSSRFLCWSPGAVGLTTTSTADERLVQ